jgi:hypothetical protein
LLHARNITSRIRGAVLGSDDIDVTNRAPATDKGKRTVDPVDEWLAASGPVIHRNNNTDGWWKLWDVSAECRDIGCMECYEGYHIALIDQYVCTFFSLLTTPCSVVSLHLFPSILRRQSPHHHLMSPTESTDSLSEPPLSFVHSLAASVLREFDFLLHWDLPISTIVEFNEVGKATHVRDVVDVQDVIDTFIPFAKRFSWLSRRVAGLVTSTVGSVALNLMPGHTVIVGDALHVMEQQQRESSEADKQATAHKIQEIDVQPMLDAASKDKSSPSRFPNLLGLEGLRGMSTLSMAPDVDGESQDA